MSTAKTIWIVAGETSGDMYGARLARALRELRPEIALAGMGGPAMAAAGVELLVDSSEMGIVGLVEVVRHLPVIRRAFRRLLGEAATARPDAVVLIDYPGFNLRLASRLHAMGIRIVYYVSPQVWAWKKGRRFRIAATVDRLLCIFPFEPEVYADTDLEVEFIGHPLLEILAEKRDPGLERDPDLVLLLPGSRQAELDRLIEPFIGTARELKRRRPSLRFVLAQPREALAALARERVRGLDPENEAAITVEVGDTHRWMQRATAGLAASGTVTVEAAILGLPMVVAYRVHWLTAFLYRRIVRLPWFTMVNLVADREVYHEFSQNAVRPEILAPELAAILPDGERRHEVLEQMAATVRRLGGGEQISLRAAERVLDAAERNHPGK